MLNTIQPSAGTLSPTGLRPRSSALFLIEQKIRVSILPIVDKLQQSKELSHSVQRDLKLLTNLLTDLTSNLDGKQELPTSLTSTELRIALLIRNLLTTDEIANWRGWRGSSLLLTLVARSSQSFSL